MLLRAWDWGGIKSLGPVLENLGLQMWSSEWFRLAWSGPQYYTFILRRKHGDTVVFHELIILR